MPEMDGYQVCEHLKADEQTRDIPVIFISSLNGTLDKVKAFSVGAVDYITKPFQAEEVVARVDTHLALRNLHKNLQAEVLRRRQAEEELQELNQQLQATNQQLQEANTSKDKLFSIIAHDLRNPFTALLGLTEALVEDCEHYEKERLKVMLGRLHTSSEKVYALLTNLLEWSRLERGLIEPDPKEISLKQIAEHNIRLFATSTEQKQIALRNLVPEGTTAYADFNMMNTVFRNLLSNALKFTDTGGTIEVSGRQEKNVVEIVISDTGIGMNKECLEKLFRIDTKCTRPGTTGEIGTGLGLILCKELVEKNGGTIRVESEEGEGTTFTFTLPTMPK